MANIIGNIPHYTTVDESNQLVSLDTPEDEIVFYARDYDENQNGDYFSMTASCNGSDNQSFLFVKSQRQHLNSIEDELVGNFYIVSPENLQDFPSWGKDNAGEYLVV